MVLSWGDFLLQSFFRYAIIQYKTCKFYDSEVRIGDIDIFVYKVLEDVI